MAKEVLDNEKLKKAKKSGEGIYSEEAGNVLKAKTPEEEYITNREVEIKEMKDKIKENKKAIKEVKKQLPSYEQKQQREKIIVEEFSIKRLSEFLSDEELETVKMGREYWELEQSVKGYDNYSGLIEKVFEGIKNLSDEEKLIIAKYLLYKQILLVNMKQYNVERGHSCEVGFYYTDFPEKMKFARKVKENLSRLGMDKYIEFIGDSCYGLSDELYKNAKQKLEEESLSDSEKEIKLEFDRLDKEGENLGKKLESIEERKYAVEKYGLPEKEAVSLYQWREDLYGRHDEFYDKESHTLVVLHEYSDYSGSGGSEYGTVISIKRGKNTTSKSFKYRDRYDYRNDNPKHEYKKIKGVKVDGDKVEVTVSRGKSTDTYIFDIVYKESKKVLSSVEREDFEESIRKVEEGLIIENTRNQTYIATHNFEMRKTPGAFNGMRYDAEIPYDKAKVAYENIIPEKGEAHITILMQRDDSGARGRQLGLIKYNVTPKGAKMVDEFYYWEDQDIDKEKLEKIMKW